MNFIKIFLYGKKKKIALEDAFDLEKDYNITKYKDKNLIKTSNSIIENNTYITYDGQKIYLKDIKRIKVELEDLNLSEEDSKKIKNVDLKKLLGEDNIFDAFNRL